MGGLNVSEEAKEKLFAYQSILSKWNSKINLTAHRSLEESLEKNFLDSIALLPFISQNKRVMDFGSGAGFPGLVLKVFFPELEIVLLEADLRKSSFLHAVIRELKLEKITVISQRVNVYQIELANFKNFFDAIVSRATISVSELILAGKFFLKPEGEVVAMVGKNDFDVGSHFVKKSFDYELPFSHSKRKIIAVSVF